MAFDGEEKGRRRKQKGKRDADDEGEGEEGKGWCGRVGGGFVIGKVERGKRGKEEGGETKKGAKRVKGRKTIRGGRGGTLRIVRWANGGINRGGSKKGRGEKGKGKEKE